MNQSLQALQSRLPPGSELMQGYFRVTGRILSFDAHGEARIRFCLSSASGDLIAIVNPHWIEVPKSVGHLGSVFVTGWRLAVGSRGSDDSYNLTQMREASMAELYAIPALQTLPKRLSIDALLFEQLITLVQGLRDARLRHFVRMVLEQPVVAEGFLKASASASYHHREPGGLLQHSLEVANAVNGFIQIFEPEMPVLQRELGIVAGLLHDIGKVRFFDKGGRRKSEYYLVEHDDLTLELCASALQWLDQTLPQGAMTLRHIWCSAAPGARYGAQPQMTLARYVRDADGQSAMADNERRAFSGNRSHGFVRHRQNSHWRPNLFQSTESGEVRV